MRRRGRILRSLLLAGLAAGVSGCWSGFAWQAAQRHESVTRYSGAWTDGEHLVVSYDVALTDADGALLSREPRAAKLRLVDLAAEPALPVDGVPVRELPAPPPLASAERAVPIFRHAGESDGASAAARAGSPPPLLLVAHERDGTEEGLEILAAAPDGGSAPERLGWLDSDTLYRDRVAWWIVPLLPLTGAVDALSAPVQILTGWPFLVFGH